jgi:hypothetical protein
MQASTLSAETFSPSTTISSPTMTAGARGRSSSKYSSALYSALGLEVTSIQGFPLGSLRKNLTLSIGISFFYLFVRSSSMRTNN